MLILGNFPLGIGLLILYAIITVVRQMLEPRVVGKQIGLYPLVTLVCMFVGTYLFGFVGLFGLPSSPRSWCSSTKAETSTCSSEPVQSMKKARLTFCQTRFFIFPGMAQRSAGRTGSSSI